MTNSIWRYKINRLALYQADRQPRTCCAKASWPSPKSETRCPRCRSTGIAEVPAGTLQCQGTSRECPSVSSLCTEVWRSTQECSSTPRAAGGIIHGELVAELELLLLLWISPMHLSVKAQDCQRVIPPPACEVGCA